MGACDNDSEEAPWTSLTTGRWWWVSPTSNLAVVTYAEAEAHRRSCSLRLVHAYMVPPSAMSSVYAVDAPGSFRAGGQEVLNEAARTCRGRHRHLRSSQCFIEGSPRRYWISRSVLPGRGRDQRRDRGDRWNCLPADGRRRALAVRPYRLARDRHGAGVPRRSDAAGMGVWVVGGACAARTALGGPPRWCVHDACRIRGRMSVGAASGRCGLNRGLGAADPEVPRGPEQRWPQAH